MSSTTYTVEVNICDCCVAIADMVLSKIEAYQSGLELGKTR